MIRSEAYTAWGIRTARPQYAVGDVVAGQTEIWQTQWREALRRALGLPNIRAELRSDTIAAVDEVSGYRRERIELALADGSVLPCYLLLPQHRETPPKVVIALHGHSRRGKEPWAGNYRDDAERRATEAADEDVGLQAVREGYAALVPDVRGFGEMAFAEDLAAGKANSCEELQRRALMFGRTLIGERVADVARLMDYVCRREDLDSDHIMLVGHSGGGTVALFAGAVDPRPRVVVPVSYFCTFEASILARHHCICNVVPGIMELGEMSSVAALIAPRPLLVVHGREDPIYPFAATSAAFLEVAAFYERMGAQDRVALAAEDGGHRFYAKPVWAFARRFL